MIKEEVEKEYFEWMYEMVCRERFSENNSYDKLLHFLHTKDFRYKILKDSNRAEDGIKLRYRFSQEFGMGDISDLICRPCSVLEMMIALAIRCEEIMDDPSIGDRTGQWFWKMVVNMGLGSMIDYNFDESYTNETVERFLNRDFEPDGRGGLFRINHCKYDLRKFELWICMLWYLDTIN